MGNERNLNELFENINFVTYSYNLDLSSAVGFVNGKDKGINQNLQYFRTYGNKEFNQKSKYFAFILYPDNMLHMRLLYHLVHNTPYSIAYIQHSPDDIRAPDSILNDIVTEEEYKFKTHIHVMIKYTYSKMYCGPIREFFKYGVFHLELIQDPYGYLTYMLHRTLSAIIAEKPIYDMSLMFRNNEFVSMCNVLNYRINSFSDHSTINPMGEIIYLIQLHAPNDYEGLVLDVFGNDCLINCWSRNQQTINNLCVRYGYKLFDKNHCGGYGKQR